MNQLRWCLCLLFASALTGCFVPSPRGTGGGGGGGGGGGAGCANTCQYAYDGECDEGSHCSYGTDCSDCQYASACDNSCEHAYDGECDDGRAGSSTSVCSYGTDCSDCGS
jgi:hypothetical protein